MTRIRARATSEENILGALPIKDDTNARRHSDGYRPSDLFVFGKEMSYWPVTIRAHIRNAYGVINLCAFYSPEILL